MCLGRSLSCSWSQWGAGIGLSVLGVMLQPTHCLFLLEVAEHIWYNGMKLPLQIVPEGSRWKSWRIEQLVELGITSRDGCSLQG